MHLFQRLIDIADTAKNLNQFVEDNIISIYDYHEKHFAETVNSRQLVEDFIVNKGDILADLDFSFSHNRSFLVILYDIAARFGLQGIERLESVVKEHNLILGERLEAAKQYLLNIRQNRDLVDRFPVILNKLQFSLENEEDDEENVVLTLLNYIAFFIRNRLPERFLNQFLELIRNGRRDASYYLLTLDIIGSVLTVNFLDSDRASEEIQDLIDKYLGREKPKHIPRDGFLIESNTEYAVMLTDIDRRFETIRQVSVNLYSPSNSTFYSLGKGVTVLENENQLFAYMYSYGKMHNKKLQTAFPLLPKRIFSENINIIDWGCGQALATMSYCDYLVRNGYSINIEEAVLVDPSALAVMRGALNIKTFSNSTQITTINKGFDGITEADFIRDKRVAKLHLFSNILDVQHFSLQHLITIVESNFPGVNYFICVSPCINDERNGRIDAFENYFSENQSYEHLGDFKNEAGSWINSWSRYVRVFKVKI